MEFTEAADGTTDGRGGGGTVEMILPSIFGTQRSDFGKRKEGNRVERVDKESRDRQRFERQTLEERAGGTG